MTSTDQVNGLVVRVYPWETGGTTRKVNVDLSTVTGATPYVAAFTAYETQAVDDTSGTPSTLAWSLATADSTSFTDATNWPSAAPNTAKYLKLTFDPAVPAGSVITGLTLTNVWRASANVTNSGTLCYYLESFNGTTSLGTHGSGSSAQNCNASGTNNVTDSVSLPEVNTVAKVPRPATDAAAPSAAMERSSFRPLERVRARGDFGVRMVFLSAWRGSLPSP